MDNEPDTEIPAQPQRRRHFAWTICTCLIVGAAALPIAVRGNFFHSRCGGHPYMLRNACIANLKQIDGAKSTWALENKKPDGSVVTGDELFGRTLYIRDTPQCPGGGIYSLRRTGEKPRCTMPGHTV